MVRSPKMTLYHLYHLLRLYRLPSNTSTSYKPASTPAAFNKVQTLGSVASHVWGSFYAIQNGSLMEFLLDGGTYTWSQPSPVATS